MAELIFSEDDGTLQLQVGPSIARLEGRGRLSFSGHICGMPSRIGIRGRSARLRLLQRVTAIVSAILFLAIAGLLLWRWIVGDQLPAIVSVSAEVASFALLGSLVSLGGASLLSVQGALAAESERIAALQNRCPFEDIALGAVAARQPGNPEFCIKCPLGIDTISERERGFLIHNCPVYEGHHRQWIRSHAGMDYLKRRGIRDDA